MARDSEAVKRAKRKYRERNRHKLYPREKEIQALKRAGLWPPPQPSEEEKKRVIEERRKRRNAYVLAWNKANPERVAATIERAKLRNPEARRESTRRWRAKHPEKAREASRKSSTKWIELNREKTREKAQIYRSKNPEKVKQANERWRKENIDYLRERWKQYAKENLPKLLAVNRRRRAKKLSIPGSHTEEEWISLRESFGNRCVCCGRSGRMTRDHVVPITNPLSSDFIQNIQPLCHSCNSKKGNYNTIDYRHTPFIQSGQAVLFG